MYIIAKFYLKANSLWVGTGFMRAAVVGPKEQFRGCGLERQACPTEGGLGGLMAGERTSYFPVAASSCALVYVASWLQCLPSSETQEAQSST